MRKINAPIFIDGILVYQKPTLEEIRETKNIQMNKLWDEVKRLEFPSILCGFI